MLKIGMNKRKLILLSTVSCLMSSVQGAQEDEGNELKLNRSTISTHSTVSTQRTFTQEELKNQKDFESATTISSKGSNLVNDYFALEILRLPHQGGVTEAQIREAFNRATIISRDGSDLVSYALASEILELPHEGGVTEAQIREAFDRAITIRLNDSNLVSYALALEILTLPHQGGVTEAQIREAFNRATTIWRYDSSLVCSVLASKILTLPHQGGVTEAQIREAFNQATTIRCNGSDLVSDALASKILSLPNQGGVTQVQRQKAFDQATTISSDGSDLVSDFLASKILTLPHQGGVTDEQIEQTMHRCLEIHEYNFLPALVNAAQARGMTIPPQFQQYLQPTNTDPVTSDAIDDFAIGILRLPNRGGITDEQIREAFNQATTISRNGNTGPVTSMAMEIHNYTRGKDKALIEELERMIKGKTSPTIHLSDEDLIKLVQDELKELFKDDPKLQENLDILPWILQTSSRQEFLELMRLFHPFLEQNDMGWEGGYGGEMNFKKRLTLFYTQLFGESADAYKGRNDPKTCIKGLLERFATALRMIHPIAKEYFAGAEADMTFFSAFKYFRENPENFVGPGSFTSDAAYQRAWADAFYKNIQEYGLKPDDAVYSKDVAYRGQTYGKVIEDASKMLTLPEPSQGKVEEAKAENPKPEKPMEEEKKEDTREPHVTQVQSAQTIQISAENELESFAQRLIAIDGGDLSPGEINNQIRNRGRELGIPETDVDKLLLTKNGKPL